MILLNIQYYLSSWIHTSQYVRIHIITTAYEHACERHQILTKKLRTVTEGKKTDQRGINQSFSFICNLLCLKLSAYKDVYVIPQTLNFLQVLNIPLKKTNEQNAFYLRTTSVHDLAKQFLHQFNSYSTPPEVFVKTRTTRLFQNQNFWEGSHVILMHSPIWEPLVT